MPRQTHSRFKHSHALSKTPSDPCAPKKAEKHPGLRRRNAPSLRTTSNDPATTSEPQNAVHLQALRKSIESAATTVGMAGIHIRFSHRLLCCYSRTPECAPSASFTKEYGKRRYIIGMAGIHILFSHRLLCCYSSQSVLVKDGANVLERSRHSFFLHGEWEAESKKARVRRVGPTYYNALWQGRRRRGQSSSAVQGDRRWRRRKEKSCATEIVRRLCTYFC